MGHFCSVCRDPLGTNPPRIVWVPLSEHWTTRDASRLCLRSNSTRYDILLPRRCPCLNDPCSQSKASVEKLTAELAEAAETRAGLQSTIAAGQTEAATLKKQLA